MLKYVSYVALASAVLFVFLIILPPKPKHSEGFEQVDYRLAISAEMVPDPRLNAGIRAFNNRDFGQCILFLEQYLEDYPEYPALSLALGISYFKVESFEQAITILEDPMVSRGPCSDEAHWYAALAYLKQGQEQTTIDALKAIRAGSNYHTRAAMLLDQLK